MKVNGLMGEFVEEVEWIVVDVDVELDWIVFLRVCGFEGLVRVEGMGIVRFGCDVVRFICRREFEGRRFGEEE